MAQRKLVLALYRSVLIAARSFTHQAKHLGSLKSLQRQVDLAFVSLLGEIEVDKEERDSGRLDANFMQAISGGVKPYLRVRDCFEFSGDNHHEINDAFETLQHLNRIVDYKAKLANSLTPRSRPSGLRWNVGQACRWESGYGIIVGWASGYVEPPGPGFCFRPRSVVADWDQPFYYLLGCSYHDFSVLPQSELEPLTGAEFTKLLADDPTDVFERYKAWFQDVNEIGKSGVLVVNESLRQRYPSED
eukprot:NODE_4093_length_863_cov_25.079853_g3777_i0.p1 GENE.NODE_4093_length_863_cov_25.079853_g3777_i0~~NODE_4093_length_863_cov_25.079853_g3777_i0.p1  ORF type:complete len:246 (-),score=34.95 NODE_4093_length_863_cov_25.079853_g3777_i0:35-772(-)